MLPSTTARYIAVSGSVATGKTTLSKALGRTLGVRVFYEQPSQNPFLPLFHFGGLGASRYAFQSQMWFLWEKHMHLKEIVSAQELVVLERCLGENLIFGKLLLTGEEIKIYMDYYQLIGESQLPVKPLLIIYLRVSVNEQLRRIRQRGTRYEQNIDERYLGQLNSRYEDWIDSYKEAPVLAFNSEEVTLRSMVRKTCLELSKYSLFYNRRA
jgi:deoxyadenosine/deoxycytidine kinase